MPIVKVIELIAQSSQGWEEAAKVAVQEASKTIKNIQSVYIKDLQAVLRDNKIAEYRVNAKISFVIEDKIRDTSAKGK